MLVTLTYLGNLHGYVPDLRDHFLITASTFPQASQHSATPDTDFDFDSRNDGIKESWLGKYLEKLYPVP